MAMSVLVLRADAGRGSRPRVKEGKSGAQEIVGLAVTLATSDESKRGAER
jgi:hypothetical protein